MNKKTITELCNILEMINEKYSVFKKLIIIGGGFGGITACEEFLAKKQILFVCDNDVNKQTDEYYFNVYSESWIPCKSFDALRNIDKDTLCIITVKMFYHEIAEQLENLGIQNYLSYESYSRCFYFTEIQKCYDSLEKEQSKDTMCMLLQADIEHNNEIYKIISREAQYFAIPEFRVIDKRETLFEAGAYVGETIEEYVWRRQGCFKKIIAFEPGKRQFTAMKHRMKRVINEWALEENQIIIINKAVGDESTILKYVEPEKCLANTYTITQFIENNFETVEKEVVTLDSYYEKEKASLVIADIEGDEKKLILGMKRLIERDKPKIAICIYHRPNDIWEIMKEINKINNTYKFDMMHHSVSSSETVLYCY